MGRGADCERYGGWLLTIAVEWTFEARKAKIDGDEGPFVRWWRHVMGGE